MNILKRIFKPKIKYISGVLEDVRPPEEKKKDFLTEEILVSGFPLNWITWENWKVKPENIKMLNDIKVHNQRGVGSCAAESGSLALAINNYLEDGVFYKFSSKPIYARRKNKPSVGMYMADLADICRTFGTLFETLYPSPNDTEANMSNLDGYISAFEGVAKLLRAKNYFWLYQVNDIDSFAQILSIGKPIVLTVIFGDGEFDTIAPDVKPVQPKYGHAIVTLPNAYFTYQGKKAILIQNSWGDYRYYGGRQILTEDWFLKNRILYGIWFSDIHNLEIFNQVDSSLPKYQWTRDLTIGSIGDDVRMLQIVLSMIQDDDGFLFPLFNQNPTGQFYGLSRSAVKRFQLKYGIEPPEGYFGIKTRAKLNSMCK